MCGTSEFSFELELLINVRNISFVSFPFKVSSGGEGFSEKMVEKLTKKI